MFRDSRFRVFRVLGLWITLVVPALRHHVGGEPPGESKPVT